MTAETPKIVCGSYLDAVQFTARLIQSSDAYVVVAGGTESMSNASCAFKQVPFGYRIGSPMIKSR